MGDVLHQVALGLEYLHSKGIIHGGASSPGLQALLMAPDVISEDLFTARALTVRADLTPGNILLKLDENEMGRLLAKLAVS